MRQFFFAAAIIGIVSCGRLDSHSQYLPPNQGNQGGYQGGQGGYQGGQGGGSQYQGGAAGGYSGSSNQYQGGAKYERGPNADIPILRLDSQNEGDGNYQYAFETGNGIQAHQEGNTIEGAGTQSQGSYSYTSPEGEQIQISYQAGENGFIPQGSHIPTPPPVPAEIQKAIEQNLADEARGVVDDGQYRPEYEGGAVSSQQQGGYQQRNQYQGAQSNQYVPPSSGQRQGGYKY